MELTKDPIRKTLIGLAWPLFFGIVAIILFSIVDTIYIGHLGAKELAAMGFLFPVIFVVQSMVMGIGIGASATIARALGEHNHKKASGLSSDALLLALTISIIVNIIGLSTIKPLFTLLGADAQMIELIKQYAIPWFLGSWLLVVPMVGNSAIRATGDTKTPSIIMIIAGVVNAVIDPFLIFGIGPFHAWGLRGAAIATIISWIITFIASLYFLKKLNLLSGISFKRILPSWKYILSIGAPTAATFMLGPVAVGVLTSMVASYGEKAVAAFGVGTRIEALALTGIFALGSSMTPFIGQNFGAKLKERIQQGVKEGFKLAAMWGAAMFILLAAGAPTIAWIFTTDATVATNIEWYLWLIPFSYAMLAISLVANAALTALHKPYLASSIVFIRLIIFSVPLAFIGSIFFDYKGILLGISVANIVIGLIAIGITEAYLKKNFV